MRRWPGAILCRSLLAALLASAISCGGPTPMANVYSEDTGEAITGMKAAVRNQDRSVIPELIKDLESDDPAVRFYAIEALQKLTAQDLGYEYFQDENARRPAVERWKKWLEIGEGKTLNSAKKVSG